MAKKVIYSDEWGEMIEIRRYRDKRTGHLLKDKTRVAQRFRYTEVEQYRTSHGKRIGKAVFRESSRETLKTTWPSLDIDAEGSIYEMLKATNVLSEASTGRSIGALVNIRGTLEDGSTWRRQFKMKLGQFNQDQQLTMAIFNKLRENDLRTNYNIRHVQFTYRGKRAAMRRDVLYDTQFAVTLFR